MVLNLLLGGFSSFFFFFCEIVIIRSKLEPFCQNLYSEYQNCVIDDVNWIFFSC